MIDTEEQLAAALSRLSVAPWLAVDTEADSLHAYPEKLCLIQISTTSDDELIDPLSGINLDPFFQTLNRHELIMHGSDYDLRLLSKHHKFVPVTIFDTMLAARLLGQRQFSLTHLVQHYLGVQLEKGPQKADWARRPLTPRMETYARNDTRFLKPVADRLRAELEEKGRLRWHQEACAQLIAECAVPRPPDPNTVWRVKGCHALSRPALAIVRELWRWREAEAVAANRPPFFILNHEILVDLAAAAAGNHPVEPLVPRHLTPRRRAGLQEAIERGQGLSPREYPDILWSAGRRLTAVEKREFHELQKRRDAHAAELGLDPTLIASKAMLLNLAQNWDQHTPELMSWQRELLQPRP